MECGAILAVARVYDEASKYPPTRCTRRALDLMEKEVDQLPEIAEAYNTQLHPRKFGASDDIVNSVSLGKNKLFRHYVP